MEDDTAILYLVKTDETATVAHSNATNLTSKLNIYKSSRKNAPRIQHRACGAGCPHISHIYVTQNSVSY